ncbi:MAG: hypothetical protein ACPGUD_09685 [Parashewanella sp.]
MAVSSEHLFDINQILRVESSAKVQIDQIVDMEVRLNSGFIKDYQFSCPFTTSPKHAAVLIAIVDFHTAYNCFPANKKSGPVCMEVREGEESTFQSFKVVLSSNLFCPSELTGYIASFFEGDEYYSSANLELYTPKLKGDLEPIQREFMKYQQFTGNRFAPSPCIYYKGVCDDNHFAVLITTPVTHKLSELVIIQNYLIGQRAGVMEAENEFYHVKELTLVELVTISFRLVSGFVALYQQGFNPHELSITDIGIDMTAERFEPFVGQVSKLTFRKHDDIEDERFCEEQSDNASTDTENSETLAVQRLGLILGLIFGKATEFGQNYLSCLLDMRSTREDIDESQLKVYIQQYLDRQAPEWRQLTNPTRKFKNLKSMGDFIKASSSKIKDKHSNTSDFNTPKMTTKLTVEQNILCLITYMLRKNTQNRASLQKVYDFINTIYSDLQQSISQTQSKES